MIHPYCFLLNDLFERIRHISLKSYMNVQITLICLCILLVFLSDLAKSLCCVQLICAYCLLCILRCYGFFNWLTFQCKREGFVQRLKDEQGEGCNIHGFVDVNKVAGNFHFAPGKSLDQSFSFLQDLLNFQPETYNASGIKFSYPYWSTSNIDHNCKLIMVHSPLTLKQISHKINKLSFGKEFPGVINPLDGYAWELRLHFRS